MKIKSVITNILGLIIINSTFAQTIVKVRILPAKIGTKTELVIPDGDTYIYEKYSDFKHVYWLLEQDTLIESANKKLIGSKITIDLTNDFFSLGYCDSLINVMRNSGLNRKTFGMLDDTTRLYIGYGNKKYLDMVREINFKHDVFYKTCHNDFVEMNSKWFDTLLLEIYKIKEQKYNRLLETNNLDTLSEAMITDFFNDYGYCNIDKELATVLIIKNAIGFTKVCDKLSDTDFYGLKLFLSDLPDDLNTSDAISALQQIDKKSTRTKKVIRKLKKNEG